MLETDNIFFFKKNTASISIISTLVLLLLLHHSLFSNIKKKFYLNTEYRALSSILIICPRVFKIISLLLFSLIKKCPLVFKLKQKVFVLVN